jgi:hypothetical protein
MGQCSGIIVLSALKADAPLTRGDGDAMVLVVMDATRHIVSTTVTTIGGFYLLFYSLGIFGHFSHGHCRWRNWFCDPCLVPSARHVRSLCAQR